MGAIAVLHTWGQNLTLHPHVHLIVPAGGIDKDGNWQYTRSGGKYLFPVTAMSAVYRGKFMTGFRAFLETAGMQLTRELEDQLYAKDWVVYAKRPFGGADQVIEYLGRYTHRIAISNHRLQSVANGQVSFTYKDYQEDSKTKVMTLKTTEFLRRFCLHILPKGFRKIRHYGILSCRNKPKLKAQQAKMGTLNRGVQTVYGKIKEKGFDVMQCPCCQTGRMDKVLSFKANAPPFRLAIPLQAVC